VGDFRQQIDEAKLVYNGEGQQQEPQRHLLAASLTLRGFTMKGATYPTSQLLAGEVGVSGWEGGWYPPTRSVRSPPLQLHQNVNDRLWWS
jgi:hypothetical protein